MFYKVKLLGIIVLLVLFVGGVIAERKNESLVEQNKIEVKNEIKNNEVKDEEIIKEKSKVEEEIKEKSEVKSEEIHNVSRGSKEEEKEQDKGNIFIVTSYDLSVQSCGKTQDNKAYGITATGISLKGKSWDQARAISTDPNVIPLGSKVYIEFIDDKYKMYEGVYKSVDTGGGIKGQHIDFFMGDFEQYEPSKECLEFGKTKAYVKIIKGG